MSNKGVTLCVKQGEELNRVFTIKSNSSALDLSDYQGIRFQVKRQALADAQPIINKMITTTSDINDVGQITSPTQGQFTVHLKEADTKFPTGEYPLIISLVDTNLNDIISSSCCNEAKYIICEQ